MFELSFTITNLNCDACVKMSTMTLRKLPGVTDVFINLSTKLVRVTSTESLNPNDVTTVLEMKGYIATF